MAQESEKRFNSIMDKLFHAPKSVPSSPSSSGAQVLRGKKRPSPPSALALVEPKWQGDTAKGLRHSASGNSPQAPVCRPWDRGDLMKRLATFKSMTWFAKPKVISAVNCARRGWVNIDQDIIACEACGARLLFSAPSSWTQQQVEKAALVFSIKLDNGHKLLCPWIDNTCEETLAQFPPATPQVLVDKFKECSHKLLKLSALPMISSSAVQYMRSPELEQFLRQNSLMEYGNESSDSSLLEYLADGCEADSANLYYQAQKLTSLCGWEPRLLPYVVDCKDRSNQSIKDVNVMDSSHVVADGQNPSIRVQSASTSGVMEATENSEASNEPQSDPKSVVLDCRLCGASVGLWAFSTVPRPVELLRLVGYTEGYGANKSGTYDFNGENGVDNRGGVNTASIDATSMKDKLPTLNMTIAGGPPPTKQNFKATISLPVIGRNLRALFSYDFDFRECINVESIHSDSIKEDQTGNTLSQQVLPEDMDPSKRYDHGHHCSTSDVQSAGLNLDTNGEGDTLRKENDNHITLEGTDATGHGALPETSTTDYITDGPLESVHNAAQGSGQNDQFNQNVENVAVEDNSSHVRNEETIGNDSSVIVASASCSLQPIPGTDIICTKESSLASHQELSCVASTVQIPANNEIVAYSTGKGLKHLPLDKEMEFNPIWQHRHFCPWIASTGNEAPGWRQTLSALRRLKAFSHPSPTNSPSGTIIKVDDPITSIRNLFASPSPKRMKLNHGSSCSTGH